MWWECFFSDKNTSMMCDSPTRIPDGTFNVTLIDVVGESLNLRLEDLNEHTIQSLFYIPEDVSNKLVPCLRIFFIDIMDKLNYYCINFEKYQYDLGYLTYVTKIKKDFNWISRYCSPNIYLKDLSANLYPSLDIQASFSLYFNTMYILAHNPGIFLHRNIKSAVSINEIQCCEYTLQCVEFCLSNQQGMWLPAIPFFLYIVTSCYGYFLLNSNDLDLIQSVRSKYWKVDLELIRLGHICPVANYFTQKLRPLKILLDL